MSKVVTQAQFIAHQQAIIDKHQKKMTKEFSSLGHKQINHMADAIIYRKKLVGFARSGKMKEFFI
jgi:hypothetical protein